MSFHINPSTGDVGVCRAKKACPFGDLESDHYSSREEASLAYERSQTTFRNPVRDLSSSKYDHLFPLMKSSRETSPTIEAELKNNGNRTVCCGKCGERLGNAIVALYLQEPGNSVRCSNCSAIVASAYDTSQSEVFVAPNPSSQTYQALVNDNVSKMLWYHTTQVEDWADTIQSPEGPDRVHLGSERAAVDRAAQLSGTPRIYVLEVSPESTIDQAIHQEAENDFKVDVEKKEDVVRYLNMYEDSGSVSLAIKPASVKVLGYRNLTREEIDSMSTYNLDQEPVEWIRDNHPEYLDW